MTKAAILFLVIREQCQNNFKSDSNIFTKYNNAPKFSEEKFDETAFYEMSTYLMKRHSMKRLSMKCPVTLFTN